MSDMTQKELEKRIDRYIKTGGCSCPFCRSDNVEGGSISIDTGVARQTVSCNICEAEWEDVYGLTDIRVIYEGNES